MDITEILKANGGEQYDEHSKINYEGLNVWDLVDTFDIERIPTDKEGITRTIKMLKLFIGEE